MANSRIAVAVFLFLLGYGEVWADNYQERRLRSGARLFRSLLAADLDIEGKVSDDGHLLILFLCDGDRGEAEEFIEAAFNGPEGSATVRKLPVRVEFVDDPAFQGYQDNVPAGIFLVHSPDERDLETIIRFAIDHHVVLFSPYEGHVEQGVLGGLVIEAQVLPHVNLSTARESGIRIKGFFLKVAKVTGAP